MTIVALRWWFYHSPTSSQSSQFDINYFPPTLLSHFGETFHLFAIKHLFMLTSLPIGYRKPIDPSHWGLFHHYCHWFLSSPTSTALKPLRYVRQHIGLHFNKGINKSDTVEHCTSKDHYWAPKARFPLGGLIEGLDDLTLQWQRPCHTRRHKSTYQKVRRENMWIVQMNCT